jgi:hypothetical protein
VGARKLEMTYNEEMHNFYASPNIISVIILRRMRRAGRVARMGKVRDMYTVFWSSYLKGRDVSYDLGLGRKIILK